MGWIGVGWDGFGWVELGWIGLGWIGLRWVALGWIGWDWAGKDPYGNFDVYIWRHGGIEELRSGKHSHVLKGQKGPEKSIWRQRGGEAWGLEEYGGAG